MKIDFKTLGVASFARPLGNQEFNPESLTLYWRENGEFILIGHNKPLHHTVGLGLLNWIKEWALCGPLWEEEDTITGTDG